MSKINISNTIITLLCIIGCSKTKPTTTVHDFTQQYSVFENKIYKLKAPIQLIGANALHSFSAGSKDMNSWNMDIAREFIGNMKQNPITGFPVQDANGSWLHSLQAVIDSNRINGRITIICPFGWDGTRANMFTGKRPTQTNFYTEYKTKLQQWATQFKNQPDVWIEVWNEPYRYDRADGYTDAIWTSDMNDMVSVIRNTGNTNIVLVPCAEQGQDESVLNNIGANFLQGKKNILFDIHAYEKWLLVSTTDMSNRITALQQKKLPIFWGEVAPMNAGTLMNPQAFLDNTYNKGMSICAWVWKYDGNDKDALLNTNGTPNNNANNNWGTIYKTMAAQTRRP